MIPRNRNEEPGEKKVQRESQHEVVLSRWPPPLWELMLNSYMPVDGSGELLFIGPIELLSGGNILGTDAAVVTGASGGDKRNCIGAQVLLHPRAQCSHPSAQTTPEQ